MTYITCKDFFFIFKYFVDNEYMKNKRLVVGWIFIFWYLTKFLNAYIPSTPLN